MDYRGITNDNISEAIDIYGPSPGSLSCLKGEEIAANESIENNLYITWIPSSFDLITQQTNRLKYQNENEQCCRIQMNSLCLCGHKLNEHKEVIKKNNNSFIRPPKCNKNNCRCFGFSYMPSRPEECGQWWLPRRRDFDIKAWRKRVQTHPDEYACIGCDLKITDHETLFETRQQRIARGAPVDEAYIPLSQTPELQQVVLHREHNNPGRSRK